MNWIVLVIAGFFEAGFAFCLGKMKGLSGIEYYLWGVGFLVCLAVSMVLLAKAVHTIPIGTAYPVWTGIGAVSTVILGIIFFHEPISFALNIFHYHADCIDSRFENGLNFSTKTGIDIYEPSYRGQLSRLRMCDTLLYRT